jgi:hypothetical protein
MFENTRHVWFHNSEPVKQQEFAANKRIEPGKGRHENFLSMKILS